MAQLDTLDIVVLTVLALGTIAYFTKGTYWGITKDPYATTYAKCQRQQGGEDEEHCRKDG